MKKNKYSVRFIATIIIVALLFVQVTIGYAAPFNSTFKIYGDRWHKISSTIPVSDDGYVQVGTLGTGNGYCNFAYILKFDSNGKIQWSKTFRASNDENTIDSANFSTVCELDDKSFIAAGTAGNDLFVVKFSNTGGVIWQKAYEKPFDGRYQGIVVNDITEKDDYIEIVGRVWGEGKHGQFFFFSINSDGTIKGENIAGYDPYNTGMIRHTTDGGYLTTMARFSEYGTPHSYRILSKYDDSRNSQWTTYIDKGINNAVIGEVLDGFILVGSSTSEEVMYAFKLDENGKLVYKKEVVDIRIKGGQFVSYLPASMTESSKSGCYIGLSSTMSTVDGVMLGLSSEGNIQYSFALKDKYPASIIDDEGNLVVSSSGTLMRVNPSLGGVVVKSIVDANFTVGGNDGIANLNDGDDLANENASLYNKFSSPLDVNYYNNKLVGFTQIGVTASTNDTIYASAKSLTIQKGKTEQIKVYMNVDGNKKDVTSECTFKPSNKSLISISKSGSVKGLKKGICKLTITRKGKTINLVVTVK